MILIEFRGLFDMFFYFNKKLNVEEKNAAGRNSVLHGVSMHDCLHLPG